jgi:succinate dehydrogenase / fumarate reductase cytochrome b subunit
LTILNTAADKAAIIRASTIAGPIERPARGGGRRFEVLPSAVAGGKSPIANQQWQEARMAEIQRHDNRLGLWGWLGGGRWGVERYAYALHRLTGLGVLFYFLMHVVVTSLRARGVYLWVEGGVFHQPVFKFGEFLVFTAFTYHAFNGVRLVLVELGFAVGKPIEPVYPYKTSLNVQRPLLVAMMVLAAVFLAVGGYEFLGLAK